MRVGMALLMLMAASCRNEPSPSAAEEFAKQERHAALEQEIETGITLPDPRFKVADYTRYYRMDRNKIIGVYIAHGMDETVWVENDDQIPMMLDGGCSVVSFSYDPAKDDFDFIRCNGVA